MVCAHIQPQADYVRHSRLSSPWDGYAYFTEHMKLLRDSDLVGRSKNYCVKIILIWKRIGVYAFC